MYAFVPGALTSRIPLLDLIPAPAVILIVWLVRRSIADTKEPRASDVQSTRDRAVRVIVWLLVAWALLLWFFYGGSGYGFSWILTFAASVLTCVTGRVGRPESESVRHAWMISGALLGAYAVLEFALRLNPVYGPLFRALGQPQPNDWSVYRAAASFPHPLTAAMFLGVAATLALVSWLVRRDGWYLAMAIPALAGLASTGSRASLAACAIGIAVGMMLYAKRGTGARFGRSVGLVVLAAGGALFIFNFSGVGDRLASNEAARSTGARLDGLSVANAAAAHTNYIGSGPATSGETARLYSPLIVENSFFQALISLGLIGTACLVLLFLLLVKRAHGSGDAAAAAGAVTLAVALAGYNALDAVHSSHLLIGWAALMCLGGAAEAPAEKSAALATPKGRQLL
ncbi:O-antigen ligase family protein [Nocardioides zeae]|uniref:O-antigen ligase family protein n=1 Tax=Nocardioides imazamoxiresistens TaxID=3231893 RepID=A0ABU3PWF9_9ACTN|nr:O-antigen ligase family protein [Nocardioides zeae]MDT9593567.1 O-antigen ligase family protein [Nocardioides zeae]